MILFNLRCAVQNFIARFRKPKPLTLDDLFLRLFMRENRVARFEALRNNPSRAEAFGVIDELIAKDKALVEKAQAEIGTRVARLKEWQAKRDHDFQAFQKQQDEKDL